MQRFRLILACLLLLFLCLSSGLTCQAAVGKQVLLPEQEVRLAVERFLVEKLAGRGWETTIRQLSIPQGIKVSSGPHDLELLVPAGWDGWGPVSVALVIRVNGIVEKNVSVRLSVDAKTEMVTATRQLVSGTVLVAGDLQLQKHDLAQVGGDPIKNIADAVGKKTRITIRAGTPLRHNQLVNVPVVVSGQLVTIVAENGGIRITVSGRARSAGSIGDLIKVQNLVSQKEIPARIVDASTVEVGF
jgi:flagella basal body P-ring formation protein FlgA